MKLTANYGLRKPDGNDAVNIEDLNYNADILDKKVKEVESNAGSVKSVNGKTGAVVLNAAEIKTNSGTSVESQLADTTKKANEAFQYANNGKTVVAKAVTAKGVPASPTDTFSILANKIGQINIKSIKSIQHGYAHCTYVNTYNISPIDLNKSILIFSQYPYGSISPKDNVLGKLINNNQIEFERYSTASYSSRISWTVIEFNDIKSIQRGDAVTGITPIQADGSLLNVIGGVVNISPVDTSKSFALVSTKYNDSSPNNYNNGLIRFSSNDKLEIITNGSNNGKDTISHWQVIEFN